MRQIRAYSAQKICTGLGAASNTARIGSRRSRPSALSSTCRFSSPSICSATKPASTMRAERQRQPRLAGARRVHRQHDPAGCRVEQRRRDRRRPGRTRRCGRRRPCRASPTSSGHGSAAQRVRRQVAAASSTLVRLVVERHETCAAAAGPCSSLSATSRAFERGEDGRHETLVDQRHGDLVPVDRHLRQRGEELRRRRAAGDGEEAGSALVRSPCRARPATVAGERLRPAPARSANSCQFGGAACSVNCSRAMCGRRARSARSRPTAPRCRPYSPALPAGFLPRR